MRWIFLILLVWPVDAELKANKEIGYVKAKTLPGDGVYSFLRRYQLDQFSCNHEEFYRLNELSKNATLQVSREYFLPILIYEYNGKSIRSTIGIDEWEKAVRIQQYNEIMTERNYRSTEYLASKILWVPFHELNCPQADVPGMVLADPEMESPENKPRHYSIFGKDYAYTPLTSSKLNGKVFYIVSGHGGPDPGAQGMRAGATLCEDEYAYDVALRLVRNLIAHGATAYMIVRDPNDGIRNEKYLKCDNDEVVWGNLKMPLNQKARLFQRSEAINDLFEKHKSQGVIEQTTVVIHVDSRSKGAQTDVFFYHFPGSDEGQKLASRIHRTFSQKYAQHRRSGEYLGTVTGRDLHMLRECKPTTVYIELGNIKNRFDQMRLILDSNRQALANWLFEGIN